MIYKSLAESFRLCCSVMLDGECWCALALDKAHSSICLSLFSGCKMLKTESSEMNSGDVLVSSNN